MPAPAAVPGSGHQFDDQVSIWMQGARADFAFPGDGWIHGVVLNIVTLRSNEWIDGSRERLAERLQGESKVLAVKFRRDSSTSDTFGFKCYDGRLGLLEIAGFTDNPRGVKIRYRMVKGAVTARTITGGAAK